MGFGVWDLGFGIWGLGFGVWDLGFGVWGLGFVKRGFGVGVTLGNVFQYLGKRNMRLEDKLAAAQIDE